MGMQLLPKKGTALAVFIPCLLWPTGRMDENTIWTEVDLGRGHIVLDGDPVPPPLKGYSPAIFSPCPLWPNGWMD